MITALVLDTDALTRAALVERLQAIGLNTAACADADEARRSLTTSLFDVVVYRRPDSPLADPDRGARRLFQELAACPTPVVALGDAGPDLDGVAAWLPSSPATDELTQTLQAHALPNPFG